VTALSTRWACPDPAATRSAAAEVANTLQPGDVILLEGDLGAGKTTFVQGLAAALGVNAPVTSPTFTLMNVYPTPRGFDLVHVDAYRLEQLSELVDLALPEMLDDGAVVVIEWGERAAPILPGAQRIVFDQSGADGQRVLSLECA
jgi:tRNA threonylcarbamoyladenosine biosynthesis protein TsaE